MRVLYSMITHPVDLDDMLGDEGQQWGPWEDRTWPGLTTDLAVWYVNSLNRFSDYQAAYYREGDVARLYVRRVR
jgi:hypothetical protein